MKTLELQLKKELLIVDLEDDAAGIINGDYEFLCDGSELTEEIASGLVETYEINFYVDYNSPNYYGYCINSLESFISAVESKGFYWLENPYDKLINVNSDIPSSMVRMVNRINHKEQWNESEEKTNRDPLIFVKKNKVWKQHLRLIGWKFLKR